MTAYDPADDKVTVDPLLVDGKPFREVVAPDAREVGDLTREHGVNPFYRAVELRELTLCGVRAVPIGPRTRVTVRVGYSYKLVPASAASSLACCT